MMMNEISALMNRPYLKCEPLIVNDSALKFGWAPIAAISGGVKLATNAVTSAPNDAPMTTATARSTRLPRNRKSLKPFTVHLPGRVRSGAPEQGHPGGILAHGRHPMPEGAPASAGPRRLLRSSAARTAAPRR